MRVIGLSGKLGSGKDFYADIIKKTITKDILVLTFADQIKINVMTKHGLPREHVYENKTSDTRLLLQKEGLGGREIDPEIWIKYLDSWMQVHASRGIETIIITDVRFKNEVEFVHKNGGIVIRIDAPDRNHERLSKESGDNKELYDKIANHASETDLDDFESFDLRIDNRKSNEDNTIENCNKIIKLLYGR